MNEKELKKKLLEKQDLKYRDFHKNLVPGKENIIGVRSPALKEIAKEIAKDPKQYLDKALKKEDEYYEETMVQGLTIGYMKCDLEERFSYIALFVPKIDNWAVCDSVCSNLKFAKKNQEETWEFLQKYISSKEEYDVRFAAVMMLGHFINDEYIDDVIKEMDKVKHEAYYVKMAVAWTLSLCYIKYPDKTMKYFKNNSLDDFTYNKALQKTMESRRIDDDTRDILRSMKRL